MQKAPLVSIAIVTYNHKSYIKQCLDSILMQKTSFPFEVLLGEDESTDGTREICIAYAKKHPDKIKLFLRSRKDVIYINGHATGRYNFIENLKACKGKYIALCEGDDYWTDPLKLQKQVDFLENNKEVTICFDRSQLLVNNTLQSHIVLKPYDLKPFKYITLLKHNNFIVTASVVFRKPLNFNLPKWFFNIPFGDLALYKIVSLNKNIVCLNDVMSVYRIHDKGIYSGLSKLRARKNYLYFYQSIFRHLNQDEKIVTKIKIKELQKTIVKLRYPRNLLLQNINYIYLRLKVNNFYQQRFNEVY